jgi:hypothetical protein
MLILSLPHKYPILVIDIKMPQAYIRSDGYEWSGYTYAELPTCSGQEIEQFTIELMARYV